MEMVVLSSSWDAGDGDWVGDGDDNGVGMLGMEMAMVVLSSSWEADDGDLAGDEMFLSRNRLKEMVMEMEACTHCDNHVL